MPKRSAPDTLLLGEVPERLSATLAEGGLAVRRAAGWREAGGTTGVDVLVTASHIVVTAADLGRMVALRVLARAAAGTDNVDLEATQARGIRFVHAPEANAQSAAELTMTLLFAAARGLAFHSTQLREGSWSRGELTGLELSGKRIGIVGLGRVGSRVARMARAIPMCAGAYDPFIPDERFAEHGCEKIASLDELAARSDVLTVHCPLTANTRLMLRFEQLALLPSGAIVLNVARGGIIDEVALAQLCASGHVRACGIDCWSEEPPPLENPLLALPAGKLVATPHMGARTREARDRVADETAYGIFAALRELGLL
ncbi:MAG: hypothetical protein HY303_06105 [Candidatus Wallbacteria bacterium]|nr:hypothetical protein [Candidatus Wallbacteria bacterium]